MKYICINDFPNPVGKPIVIEPLKDENGKDTRDQTHVVIGGKPCREHIHKGAVFNIGTATEFKELAPAEKILVSHLMVSKKIAEATDDTIKRVDSEVKSDAELVKRDAEAEKAVRGPSMSEIMEALPDLIAKAVAAAVASLPRK